MKELVADRPEVWAAWYAAGLVSEDGSTDHLPLGCVVAVGELVDVVPMVYNPDVVDGPCLDVETMFLWERSTAGPALYQARDVVDQRPYGDFAPGRFGHIYRNVQPLAEPVPARGHQSGYRDIAPDVYAAVMAQVEVSA